MKILALDIALKVGWCIDGETGPRYGTWTNPATGEAYRYLRFSEWLCDFFDVDPPDLCGHEAPLFGGGKRRDGTKINMSAQTAGLLIGLSAHALSSCAAYGVRPEKVSVNTVRDKILGRGNAPKSQVVAYVKALGFAPETDDEADAIALWLYLKTAYDKSFRLEAGTPLFGIKGAAA